jgi:membrane protease YdiL (CAAX protease family)
MTMSPEIPIERGTIIKITLLQAAIFLAVALGYAAMVGDIGAIGLTLRGWEAAIAWGVILFLATVPFLYLPRYFGVRNQLEEALALGLRTRDMLLLNLAVSWSEELLFRGLLIGIIGVIPSALLFGAMHYIGYESLLEVVYAVSTGLVLGYAFKEWVPNILFPVTFHLLANLLSLSLTRRWARRP